MIPKVFTGTGTSFILQAQWSLALERARSNARLVEGRRSTGPGIGRMKEQRPFLPCLSHINGRKTIALSRGLSNLLQIPDYRIDR